MSETKDISYCRGITSSLVRSILILSKNSPLKWKLLLVLLYTEDKSSLPVPLWNRISTNMQPLLTCTLNVLCTCVCSVWRSVCRAPLLAGSGEVKCNECCFPHSALAASPEPAETCGGTPEIPSE